MVKLKYVIIENQNKVEIIKICMICTRMYDERKYFPANQQAYSFDKLSNVLRMQSFSFDRKEEQRKSYKTFFFILFLGKHLKF